MILDADLRPTCAELLKHDFFCRDGFSQRFIQELKIKVAKENEKKPLNKSSAKSEKSSADSSGRDVNKKKKSKTESKSLTRKVMLRVCVCYNPLFYGLDWLNRRRFVIRFFTSWGGYTYITALVLITSFVPGMKMP